MVKPSQLADLEVTVEIHSVPGHMRVEEHGKVDEAANEIRKKTAFEDTLSCLYPFLT